MNETRWQRWAAASGFVALACGVAAVALERPWPSTSDPAAFPAFLADNHGAILAQSMLFVISAGLFMWFLASLRSFLIEAEGATGRLSTLAFTAGMIGYGLNVVGQAPQITLTLPSAAAWQPGSAAMLTDLGWVMLIVANIPLAVMFFAVAAVSLRTRVFPVWLGWLAVVAGVAAVLLSFAVVDPGGPLAPQGWASYLLYPASIVWLLPATTVMIRRIGRRSADQHGPGAHGTNGTAHQLIWGASRAASGDWKTCDDDRSSPGPSTSTGRIWSRCFACMTPAEAAGRRRTDGSGQDRPRPAATAPVPTRGSGRHRRW